MSSLPASVFCVQADTITSTRIEIGAAIRALDIRSSTGGVLCASNRAAKHGPGSQPDGLLLENMEPRTAGVMLAPDHGVTSSEAPELSEEA